MIVWQRPGGEPILGFIEVATESLKPRAFATTPGQTPIHVSKDICEIPGGSPLRFNDPMAQIAKMISRRDLTGPGAVDARMITNVQQVDRGYHVMIYTGDLVHFADSKAASAISAS